MSVPKYHKLKLSADTEHYLRDMQKEFMPEDTKVGRIQAWLDNCGEDYVCSLMLYKEALHHEYEEPKQYEIREINDIMNHSIEGWKKSPQHRFKEYGRQASWKRENSNGEFLPIPEDEELPFT